ncbi:MAG: methionyl-tRNA formyltransferase [Bacillota bacterium]
MNIAFLGTPEFAIPSLEACVDFGNVKVVVTQPDRKSGRGKKVRFPPIKKKALDYDLEVYQPKDIKDEKSINYLKSLNLDLIVVVAYGQILSKEILDIPRYGCINVHASLLPKLRGAAPIHWAIVRGYEKTGVTTMQMDEGLDTGDILLKEEIKINPNMTVGKLHDSLKILGKKVLLKTLNDIKEDKLKPIKQDDKKSTYAPMLDKKMGKIDFNKSSQEIHDLVRGFNPWPTSYTYYKDKKMKVLKTKILDDYSDKETGIILNVDNKGIVVSTKDKNILIEKIQFPNKRKMSVKDYINGNEIKEGIKLGG